jgi:2-oxoglutarate ferredoxin oxidoreductase subunit alpha
MADKLMKGNEALAEGALRAGCRFYAGYPITPQNEILEYMSEKMPELGGTFIQGESEIASVSMVWGAAAAGARAMTSSSGPGFSLKQEGIAYMASYGVPAVLASVMRYGVGGGDITQGQDSYLQAVKGGGNGDYRLIVLSPASVEECARFGYEAFDLAEKYRNPVLILSDGAVGQMAEPCKLPEAETHDINKHDWYIKGRPQGEKMHKATNLNWYWGNEAWECWVREKYTGIMENEQRWEAFETRDAEIILIAFGVSARICKKAVVLGRQQGLKLGLIRPITLWPYPRKAFEGLGSELKGFLSVQMDITGQMAEDIYLADRFRHPVYAFSTAIEIPRVNEILEKAKEILCGEAIPKEAL